MTPLRDLVDGLATGPDYSVKPSVAEQCVRGEYKHSTAVRPGFSFCPECLAWLQGESNDDPLGSP